MSKNFELEELILRLEMLSETLTVIEEAVECSPSELPKHYLYLPVRELSEIVSLIHQLQQ